MSSSGSAARWTGRRCSRSTWAPARRKRRATGSSTATARPARSYADLRAANGSPEPYAVKLWCLGNEMDGPWQLGHVPADQYAIRAQQAAKMMKDVDKTHRDWSSAARARIGLPTYMEWDRQVLEYLGDFADYISLHRYVGNRDGRHARLPGGHQLHRPADRGDGRGLPLRPGPAAQQEARLPLLRRVERLVQEPADGRRGQVRAAPDRGGLQPGGRAGRRRASSTASSATPTC